MNPGVWIIIPAYNEEKVIASVLKEFRDLPYQVVVVDDGSRDATRTAALGVPMRFPVIVLRHLVNLGQGAALRSGIQFALRQPNAQQIVTFDADGQHHPADIAALLSAAQSDGVEVVLGSRFLPGSQRENMPASRSAAIKLAVVFTRLTTGLPLTDAHNGLRLFSRAAAARLQLTQNGMAHASEILSEVARLRLPYREAPVTVTYTEYSRSKGQSLWNSFNILWELITGWLK